MRPSSFEGVALLKRGLAYADCNRKFRIAEILTVVGNGVRTKYPSPLRSELFLSHRSEFTR